MTVRQALADGLAAAIRAVVPLSALMVLIAIAWFYAVLLSAGFYAIAWLIDAITNILTPTCQP